jgi:Family of unknown function (DUF6338)
MRVTDLGVAMGIPSGLTGVLTFVVLLWPGFVYNSIRARHRPERQLTALQETIAIVTASLTAVAITGMVFGLIRVIWPGRTPDVRSLLFQPHAYLQAHYVTTAWWGGAFIVAAVFGAAGVAFAQGSRRFGRIRLFRLLAPLPDPSSMSAWWIAFSGRDLSKEEIHVGCTMDDGSFISGRLYSYSQLGADSADRDLVLRAPLSVRAVGSPEAAPIERAALMTVSARNIISMMVTYVRKPAPPVPLQAPEVPEVAAPGRADGVATDTRRPGHDR